MQHAAVLGTDIDDVGDLARGDREDAPDVEDLNLAVPKLDRTAVGGNDVVAVAGELLEREDCTSARTWSAHAASWYRS